MLPKVYTKFLRNCLLPNPLSHLQRLIIQKLDGIETKTRKFAASIHRSHKYSFEQDYQRPKKGEKTSLIYCLIPEYLEFIVHLLGHNSYWGKITISISCSGV